MLHHMINCLMPYRYILYNSDPVEWWYRINVTQYVAVRHKFDFAWWREDQYGEGFDRINAVQLHTV
jgi:hypothetical protein